MIWPQGGVEEGETAPAKPIKVAFVAPDHPFEIAGRHFVHHTPGARQRCEPALQLMLDMDVTVNCVQQLPVRESGRAYR